MFGKKSKDHDHHDHRDHQHQDDRWVDREEAVRHTERHDASTVEERQRDRFGGTSVGGAFFGWLCAIGVVILLSGIIGAVAAAVGTSQDLTQTDAERRAGTIGIAAGIVLLVVLAIGYFCGGYVAGRMARFNGVKQGRAVWLLGLLVTIVAAGVGAVFGNQYNVLARVDLPEIPIPTEDLSVGGAVAVVAAIVITLLAAIAGGKAGTRFHRKVDRVA